MAAKLGILAGGGDLPARLVGLCREQGREVFVVAFEGQTDPDSVQDVDHCWRRLGAVADTVSALREAGVKEVVMAGRMSRPSFSELKLDLYHAYLYAKLGVGAVGDDGLLRAVIGYLEGQGFVVIGVDQVMGHLVAGEGCFGRERPDQQAEVDIRRGVEVASALGAQDVGQAAVVQQGVVLGVEAVEGTDALLARCAGLARGGDGGVLVKVKKPNQDRRADLPTIGLATVEGAARAGLRGIAIEAGGALIIDQSAVVRAADAAGLFVIGIAVDR